MAAGTYICIVKYMSTSHAWLQGLLLIYCTAFMMYRERQCEISVLYCPRNSIRATEHSQSHPATHACGITVVMRRACDLSAMCAHQNFGRHAVGPAAH